VLTPQAKQGLERGHRSPPPVEAKRELIQIGLEVLVGDSMVCPAQPSVEGPENTMDPRQHRLGPFRIPLGARAMAVSHRREGGVTRPAIGDDDTPRLHVQLYEAGQGRPRGVGNDLEAVPRISPRPQPRASC